MKMPPELVKAMENMQPGKIVKTGFLGNDDRQLVDIIQQDEELMIKNSISFEQVAEKMKYFMIEGAKGLGEPITVEKKWLVKIDEPRGVLPCPFQDKMNYKRTAHVKNIKTNEDFFYSDLSIHLLEKHHFFQGKGSDFRLEPAMIKRILEI